MIRAPAEDNNRFLFSLCLLDHPVALRPDSGQVGLIFAISRFCRSFYLFFINILKILAENFRHLFGEVFPPVNADIIMDKGQFLQYGRVGGNNLWVVGYHRTVVMIVAQALIKIIGHAGVKNRFNIIFYQGEYMAMHEFSRKTYSITGNRRLSFNVQVPVGESRGDNLKAQLGEKCVPEGEQLIHVQPHGNPDFSKSPVHTLQGTPATGL